MATYGRDKVAELLGNPGIVRNRQKIASAIANARAFLEVQAEFGTFDRYLWDFVGGKPIVNAWQSVAQLPAQSRESDALSKDLRRRGFSFVGSTICYALMQAVGLVNDHTDRLFSLLSSSNSTVAERCHPEGLTSGWRERVIARRHKAFRAS